MKLYRKYKSFFILYFLFMAVFFGDSRFSYVAKGKKTEEIRVGLTKEFSGKSFLTLKNHSLILGFSKNNQFMPLEKLESKGGLRFQKKIGSFTLLPATYSSLEKANQGLRAFRRGGGDLFPVFSGIKGGKVEWKLGFLGLKSDFRGVGASLMREDGLLLAEMEGGKFYIDGISAGGYPQFAVSRNSSEKILNLEGKKYRGRIEIGSYRKSGVTAVNIVNIEDYIKGVLPLEMGYTWHIEAMKAQAVAARSFAYRMAGFQADSDLKDGYHLNNHSHQSYGGFDVEGKKPSRACRKTFREYLTYKGRVVEAYFYSSSGGATELPENVWGGKKPYLRVVSDIYEKTPFKKPWTFTYEQAEVERMLSPYSSKKGQKLGRLQSMKVWEVSESGRVIKLRVKGTEGSFLLERNEIREAFQLPSTKFNLFDSRDSSDEVHFLSEANHKVFRRKGGLKGRKVLTGRGKSELSLKSENDGQVIVLSAHNRKGYYIGSLKKGAYTFVGSGFGHGVGMSQSGARGMAEEGFSYRSILFHYYRGTEIRKKKA